MDTDLVEALVEGYRFGFKENNIWDDKIWTMVQKVVQEKAFIQVERSHIDNRYLSLRKRYIVFDVDNDIGGDDALEANNASMATSSASKRSRVHGKKAKNNDEVKPVLYSLHSSLEDMKNSIDLIKHASDIQEEVMKVEGYSEHFLRNAWYIMMRDPVELQLFMAGDAKDKKMVLDGYLNRIYECGNYRRVYVLLYLALIIHPPADVNSP
ncbi:hypothetical protein GIB67_004970 [Kingdonia uniflora]|uniref:Myb/SANT-like domain-containing protein n=1 Tax=Kingdonia uniflora TaxID=39325 RepID=A0A7J7NNB2_9MAGN|nr:hypothetical protein GIB67_004970 [Kingdonia uniflora]